MLANDLDTARFNMIVQQIRPNEVIDERVLETLQRVPRERFVPPEYIGLAFADVAIPLPGGQQMMKPWQEARMLQALNVQPGDRVLEIGTGSGFVTACLADLGGVVTSYETDADLSRAAAERLATHCRGQTELVVGDGLQAGLAPASFDVIAVTGSVPTYPAGLEALLAGDGRMFVVVGEAPAMTAWLVTASEDGDLWRDSLFETVVPPLQNAPQPDHFVF